MRLKHTTRDLCADCTYHGLSCLPFSKPTKGFVLPSWQDKTPKGTSGPLQNTKWVYTVNLLSEYVSFLQIIESTVCFYRKSPCQNTSLSLNTQFVSIMPTTWLSPCDNPFQIKKLSLQPKMSKSLPSLHETKRRIESFCNVHLFVTIRLCFQHITICVICFY